MNVYITKERVWWTLDTEDKPSLEYFNSFESTLTLEPVRVNYKDYLNVNIVANTDDITYVKVVHNDNTYYYFTDGIETILAGGYQYRLKLDTYSTFTLPFIKQLAEQNIPVHVLRHSTYGKYEQLLYRDVLLDNVVKVYDSIKFYDAKNVIKSGNKFTNINNNNSFSYTSNSEMTNGVMCYVFAGVRTERLWEPYIILPLLAEEAGGNGYNINGWTETSNNYNTLESLKSSVPFSSSFIGVFYLPNFLNFNLERYNISFNVVTQHWNGRDWEETKTPTTQEFVRIKLDLNNYSNFKFKLFRDDGTIFNKLPDNEEPVLNSTKITSRMFYQYLTFKWFENVIDVPRLMTKNGDTWEVNLNGMFSFTGNGNLLVRNQNETTDLNDTLIKFTYQIPSVSNAYAQYVNSNYNSTNTGLAINRQQALLSAAKGTAGLIGNVFTGNIGGTVNSIFGLLSGGLGVYNKVRQVQAQYKDAMSSTPSVINYNSDTDNSFTLPLMSERTQTDKIQISKLSNNVIKQMNNILYLNGVFLPEIDNINKYLNINFNGFRYLLLEQDYLQRLLPVYVAKKVPKRHYIDIMYDLAGGVRIWDKIPEYKIPEYKI